MNDQWYNLSGGLALYALSLTQCSIHNFRSKILSIWVEIPRRILYQNIRLTIMDIIINGLLSFFTRESKSTWAM